MTLEDKVLEIIDNLELEESELLQLALESYMSAKEEARAEKTQRALKAAESAKRHLESTLVKYKKNAEEESFKTIVSVHKYLTGVGYKVSERTISNHIKNGYFSPRDGVYRRTDVDAYAEKHLQQMDDDGYVGEKMKADIHQKHLRSQMLEVELQRKRGELIEREKVGREFAARIVALRQDLDDVFSTLPDQLDGKSKNEQRQILSKQKSFILARYARALEAVK
ncbi:hypothetical protein [Limisalsivibrio acetivorans]|uniref:hypothetical protein n=1 Tax=Limisalsivibrio acetivorans TaxID=1304888 RepID=UPI0003B7A9B3|nr:hypothetical protein [Limisalsivibrio acetivorans]